MAAPAYTLTNYLGTADPAGDLITLIETNLTSAGWVFIEQTSFTQAATARVQRTWKCPGTQNAAGVDYYVGLVKNVAAGVYFATRVFESWDSTGKTMIRPVLTGNGSPVAQFTCVAYGAGKFVALTNSSAAPLAATIAATSTDGITWTANQAVNLPVGNWSSITYGNSTFVAVQAGSTNAATSSDGITWTLRTLPSSVTWGALSYGGGKFLTVDTGGGSSVAATSPDGITWTAQTMPASVAWKSTAYGSGLFVAIFGSSSNTICYSSPDGATWTGRNLQSSATWAGVVAGGGRFIATSNGTATAYSTDGISWTAGGTVTSGNYSLLAYGNSTFVIALPGSTSAYTSPDGVTWTSRTLATSSTWASMAYGNSTFVMVSNGSTASAMSSPDGATWTSRYLHSAMGGGAVGNYALNSTSYPLFIDAIPVTALVASTNYDIGILASKSYLAIAVNLNATATQVFAWVLGLYQPSYADAQATYPPLMMCSLDVAMAQAASGVSRNLRPQSDSFPFSIAPGPESLLLGNWTGGVKEPLSQSIRGSRVALGGGAQGPNVGGFVSTAGFRGWMYDAMAVAAQASTVHVGDTATVGATNWVALGSPLFNTFQPGAASQAKCAIFFNPTTGS